MFQKKQNGTKIISFFMILIAIMMIISGIIINFIDNGKVLTCTDRLESYGMIADDTVSVYFKNDEIDKITMIMETTLADDSFVTFDNIKNSVEKQQKQIEQRGIRTKIDVRNNTVTLKVFYTEENLTEAINKKNDDEYSYDWIKEYYEDQGFECK